MKSKLIYLFIAISLIGFTGMGVENLRTRNHQIQLKEIQLKDTSIKLKNLNQDYEKLLDSKEVDTKKLEELQQEKKELESKLQAKLKTQNEERIALNNIANLSSKVYADENSSVKKPVLESNNNCGNNTYKQFIYMKESGCRTTAINSIGCRGIGQACPGSKLPCGDDFACQDSWFSNYAIQRYGSWESAYNFWIVNKWW